MTGTWAQVTLGLLSGGAMGAIIKLVYDAARGRRQPISSRVSIFSLFRHDKRYEDFEAVLSVSHSGSSTEFRTLFVADIMLHNSSNHDYPEFEFGVSLGADSRCIHVGWDNPDQHHILKVLELVSPSESRAELKFRLKPFNRRDLYSLRLYLIPGLMDDPFIKGFTSPHAVRFLDDPNLGDSSSNWLWIAIALLLLLLATSFAYNYRFTSSLLRQHERDEARLQRYIDDCEMRASPGVDYVFNPNTLACEARPELRKAEP